MPIRRSFAAFLLLAPFGLALAQDDKPKEKEKPAETKPADKLPDLTAYKTVKTAVPGDANVFKEMATNAKPVVRGFIGIEVVDAKGKPTIEDVASESPAEKAGLKKGDVIAKIGDADVSTTPVLKDHLRGLIADEKLTLSVVRGDKTTRIEVTPKAASKPMAAGPVQRAFMGVGQGELQKGGGVELIRVTEGGAAEKAGVKVGDILLSVDEQKIDEKLGLTEILDAKKPGDAVKLLLKRGKEDVEVRVTLVSDAGGPAGRPGADRNVWNDNIPSAWKKAAYKLAVIGIDYPDQKHNEKVSDADWEKSLFSVGEYADKSATGQKAYGSMQDYYKEISYGKFKVEGKFIGWTEVSKKRLEYQSGNGVSTREKTALLTETMDKLLAKKKDALDGYDGVFFLFAGGRVQTTRGSLYWPHRANFNHNGKRWPYFIVQEGGDNMTNISVFCHEFGHMLGLPDLYARPEVPGMEGVGSWCAMSQQSPNGQPQHFSVWSKEQLKWVQPTLIDPRVKQKLILSPIEDDATQCFKVPLKADGSEYLLLENRNKKGFDKSLPAEGLLIWRVLPGNQTQKVFLEESHGIEGPSGPRANTGAVPYPSPANDSFTPYTTPSSKSQTGGGFDVYITNIRRLPDGRITFHIGYEYQ